MQTEAQKRASIKYVKEKVHRIEVRFYPAEEDLYKFTQTLGGSSGIKKALRDLMDSKANRT